MIKNKFNQIVRVSLIMATVVFAFLLCKKFFGNFKVEYDFSYVSHPFISMLRPFERLGDKIEFAPGKWHQKLKGEPVYFEIEAPRRFKKVDLEIEYKFPPYNSKLKDFKLGVLIDKINWQYKLEPIENVKLEQLLNDWQTVEKGDIKFLQGIRKYETIDHFLNELPTRNEIATYNYDLRRSASWNFSEYEPRESYNEFNAMLKGYHQIYIYTEKEPIDFIFFLQGDNKQGDVAAINIYDNFDNLILSKNLIVNEKLLREARIYEDLGDGAHKIEIKIPDHFFVTKILTKQAIISFIDKLNIADSKPVTLYTDAPFLKIAASSGNSLQTISVMKNEIVIDELFKQYTINHFNCENFSLFGQSYCLSEITMPKGNLLVQGPGNFSFSKKDFINPRFRSLEQLESFNDLKYVIARYRKPRVLGDGWKNNNISFDISGVSSNENKYQFIISAIGLGETDEVWIRKISAEFFD